VAIYLTCEDDGDELHRRQVAICDALDLQPAQLSGKLFLASLAGGLNNELATFDNEGRLQVTPAWHVLRQTVLGIGAGFIVVDNTAHLFAGNENVRNEVAAFVNLLNGLAAETGGAVLLLGHPNKAGDAYSGSTAWENQVRSRLFLDRPRDTDGSILDPDARTLTRAKANYARNGEALAFRWHRWAFVREEDLPPDTAREIADNVMASAANLKFLACLAKCTEQRENVSHATSAGNYAPKVFSRMALAKGYRVKDFEGAMRRLLDLGTIRANERVFRYDNRTWAKGLALAAEGAQRLAQNPAQSLAEGRTEAVLEGAEN
jgi:RecA-family ATPase